MFLRTVHIRFTLILFLSLCKFEKLKYSENRFAIKLNLIAKVQIYAPIEQKLERKKQSERKEKRRVIFRLVE